jgi:hypothetical protein
MVVPINIKKHPANTSATTAAKINNTFFIFIQILKWLQYGGNLADVFQLFDE